MIKQVMLDMEKSVDAGQDTGGHCDCRRAIFSLKKQKKGKMRRKEGRVGSQGGGSLWTKKTGRSGARGARAAG